MTKRLLVSLAALGLGTMSTMFILTALALGLLISMGLIGIGIGNGIG